MNLGPFYLGQVPSDNLVIRIRDYVTDEQRELDNYEEVEFRLVDPQGDLIDTSQGTASIMSTPEGDVVIYSWPQDSLFTQVGDHRYQIILTTASGVKDATVIEKFEVFTPLGEL